MALVFEQIFASWVLWIDLKTQKKSALLEEKKLEREISDGKNKIRHKFFDRKI